MRRPGPKCAFQEAAWHRVDFRRARDGKTNPRRSYGTDSADYSGAFADGRPARVATQPELGLLPKRDPRDGPCDRGDPGSAGANLVTEEFNSFQGVVELQ